MEDLISHISKAETRANAIKKIILYLPCVIHLENHVLIKILTMLLTEGLSNATEGRIEECNKDTIKKRDNYILENQHP